MILFEGDRFKEGATHPNIYQKQVLWSQQVHNNDHYVANCLFDNSRMFGHIIAHKRSKQPTQTPLRSEASSLSYLCTY